MHLHSQLSSRSSALARELRNPFCAARAVPAGPWPRAAARAAQSLDSALRCAAGVASAGSAVLDGQGRLLWTSLPEGCAEGLAAWAGAERPAPGPAALQPGARWEACEVDARGSGADGAGPASVLLLRSAGEARLPKLHLGSPPRPFECLLLSMAPADLRVIVALDTSGGGCSKAQAAALHNLARPWLEPLIKVPLVFEPGGSHGRGVVALGMGQRSARVLVTASLALVPDDVWGTCPQPAADTASAFCVANRSIAQAWACFLGCCSTNHSTSTSLTSKVPPGRRRRRYPPNVPHTSLGIGTWPCARDSREHWPALAPK